MTDQLTRGDLAAMTPQQITEAKNDGRLNELLGHTHDAALIARAEQLEPVTREQLAQLSRLGRPDLAGRYAQHLDQITR